MTPSCTCSLPKFTDYLQKLEDWKGRGMPGGSTDSLPEPSHLEDIQPAAGQEEHQVTFAEIEADSSSSPSEPPMPAPAYPPPQPASSSDRPILQVASPPVADPRGEQSDQTIRRIQIRKKSTLPHIAPPPSGGD